MQPPPPMPVLLPAQAYASFPLCMTCMCIACMHAYMNVCLLHEHHAWSIVSICVAWNHWRRCRRPRRQCSQRGTASNPRSIHMASMPLQQCHSIFPLPCLTPSSQRAAINAGIALEQQVVHPPNSNPLMGPQQPQHPPPQQLQQQQQQQPLLLPLQQPQQQQQQVRLNRALAHVLRSTDTLSYESCIQVHMLAVPVQGHAHAGILQSWMDRLPPGAGPSSRLLLLCECVISGDAVTSDSMAQHFYGGYHSDQV